jgi:hypothetical protein
MLKRNYSDFQNFTQEKLPSCFEYNNSFSKKFKSQTDTFNDINITLSNISLMLEKINSRLESCEKKIEYLYDCQIKFEQEKIEQKLHDTEIFNSYIS